jgi:hypothetical protein
MKDKLIMRTIICLFVVILLGLNIFAQEIGLSPTKIWTDNYEIENPFGYSVHFFQPIGKYGVMLEVVTARNSRSFYGTMNTGLLVGPDVSKEEQISTSSTFRAIEFSILMRNLIEVLHNQINIGTGASFDRFTRDKSGLTTGKSYSTIENKFGLFYLISLSRQFNMGVPIKLEILFKQKVLMGGTYATDLEQPFTGAMEVKELQFNFTYIF